MEYMHKSKVLVVMEGFMILILAHSIGGFFFAPILANTYTDVPTITLRLASSSAVSPLVSILYLGVRSHFAPKRIFNSQTLSITLAGIIAVWLIFFTKTFIFDRHNDFVYEISTPGPYFKINLILCLMWIPLIEEILFRGYIYEILAEAKGKVFGVILSSFLFVLLHAIFIGQQFDLFISIELVLMLIQAMIYCAAYTYGGLISSFLVHAFSNIYAILFYFKS